MSKAVFLLATGSFNPPTIMHLRIMELARDYLQKLGFKVIGGAISPVHDGYGKKGLAPSHHRLKMVQLALKNNDWVKLSSWEATKNSDWTRTRVVLEHHQSILNEYMNGSSSPDSSLTEWLPDKSVLGEINPTSVQLKVVCGADYLESFNVKDLWKDEDTIQLARDYGFVVISRHGNDPSKSIYNNDILYAHQGNINIVREWIDNDISSTKIRRAVQRSESIRYLVPDDVISYMTENRLYQDPA